MNVHADGIFITAEFLSWKWYNTTTMRLLLHLALLSMESGNATVKVSLRSLAVSLRVSYKEIRTAFRHLQEEGVVSLDGTTTHTVVHFEPWSNIDECFMVQWAHEGRTKGARTILETNELDEVGAHEGRTKGARLKNLDTMGRTKGAQTPLEIIDIDTVGAHEGRTNCKDISYIEKRAHENLEEGAQTLLEINELDGVGAHDKKTKGAHKKVSPLVPSSFSPTTPISTPPIPPSQNEKKKKRVNEKFFSELKEKFNATFQGTRTPRINKIDDDRKNLVKQFIEDYSIEAIDTLLQKVRESTELMKHRRNGNCPFGWIFVPRNYNDIMQGNYDDFQPNTSDSSAVPSVAVEQQPEDKQVRWNAQRDRWLDLINLVKEHPNSSAKGQLYTAYQHGVLKEYNIDWEPPAEKTLADIATTSHAGAVPSVGIPSQPNSQQLEYVKNILKRT